jgi:hypothetical protein
LREEVDAVFPYIAEFAAQRILDIHVRGRSHFNAQRPANRVQKPCVTRVATSVA